MAETEPAEDTLDSIFSDEELSTEVESEVVEETTEEPEETESKEEVTEEKEPTTDSAKDEKAIPIAALLDEREKRQASQKRVEELERQLKDLETDTKRPSVFEDEDGAFQAIEQNIQNARLKDRIDMSRDFMSMLKDDFADREKEFLTLADADPTLRDRLREHPNPARFAYETAVKHQKLQAMENVDEWEAKERARIREEILKELESEKTEESEKQDAKREAITPSLARGRSTSGTKEVVDESLDDILHQ